MKRAAVLVGFAVLIATVIRATTLESRTTLAAGVTADLVLINKSERTLTLSREGQTRKVYQVALGRNPIGHKQQEGDGRTPEGRYRIDFRNRQSQFHRALHISYPNATDIRNARSRRVSPGGAIMIHGLPNGWGKIGKAHLVRDWTEGCIAVTNEEIEEIWRAVPNGTVVEIKP